MKINIEVDLEPEELRRLIGLPDAQPFWDAVNERIKDGDTEFMGQMMKSMFSEASKSTELINRLLRNVPFMGGKDEPTANEKKTAAKKPAKPKSK